MEPIKVKTYEELNEYSRISAPGTLATIEVKPNQFKLYIFDGKIWKPSMNKGGITMTAYEMNKQIVKQLPDYKISDNLEKIDEFFNTQSNKYFMLLCNDLHYFTIFNRVLKDAEMTITDAFIDILENSIFNIIKAIDVKDDNSLEIWFIDENHEVHVAYLFNYDAGVIECI